MNGEQKEFTVESHLRGAERRRIEGLLDPLHFDTLFEYANTLLVSKPIVSPVVNEPLTEEAQVIQKYGTRGLRTAFELMNGTDTLEQTSEGIAENEVEDKNMFELRVDSPLLYPLAFSGELDHQALKKAELLGEQLMSDMFKILGQDAYVMADRMRDAETDEEQIAIAQWLDDRLDAMTHSIEDPANSGLNDILRDNPSELPRGYTYHPARLSGPIIGSYPEHRMAPTCLGVSIAVTGFMQRAGLEVLHGGVMKSRREHIVDTTELFLLDMPNIVSERFNITLPDKFLDRTKQGADHLITQFLSDVGYHHCVLVRLKSGRWMQIDPNYNRTLPFNLTRTDQQLDVTSAFLKEMKEVGPGLEVTQELEVFSNYATSAKKALKEAGPNLIATQVSAEGFLQDLGVDTESLQSVLFDEFTAPFFAEDNDGNEAFQKAIDFIKTQLKGFQTAQGDTVLYDTFCSVLEKYVFDGMSPSDFLQRCHEDPLFLTRAANDLRSSPFMVTSAITMNMMDHEMYELGLHPVIEVGLPATRIGLATLSDVAQFHDVSPSPTFWLSNWPSLQPITEVPYLEYTSKNQAEIVHNNVQSLGHRSLIYTVSYGKVSRIQSDQLSREEDDGTEKEVQS